MLLLFFLLLSAATVAQCALVRCSLAGPWNDSATWEGGRVPEADDDVVIQLLCGLRFNFVSVDSSVTVRSLSMDKTDECECSLVVEAQGRLQASQCLLGASCRLFLNGGSVACNTLRLTNATLGGAGNVTGKTVSVNGILVPGVTTTYQTCWAGYPSSSASGDLVFTELELSGGYAHITTGDKEYKPRLVPSPNISVSSIYAAVLTVSAATSFGLVLDAIGPFLRWGTLFLYGSIERREPIRQCGSRSGALTQAGTATEAPTGLVGSMCPATLGVLSFGPQQCPSSCSCAVTETCDPSSQLCRLSVPPVGTTLSPGGNSTTLPQSSGGGVETWVILVAVLVPVAALAGVGAVLLMRHVHVRKESGRTDSINRELRDEEMTRLDDNLTV